MPSGYCAACDQFVPMFSTGYARKPAQYDGTPAEVPVCLFARKQVWYSGDHDDENGEPCEGSGKKI